MTWTEHKYHWETQGFTIAMTGRPGEMVYQLFDLRTDKRGTQIAVRWASTREQGKQAVAELKAFALTASSTTAAELR